MWLPIFIAHGGLFDSYMCQFSCFDHNVNIPSGIGSLEPPLYIFQPLYYLRQLMWKTFFCNDTRSAEFECIFGLEHGLWQFYYSHVAGTFCPSCQEQAEKQAPKRVVWTVCFHLMTLVLVQQLILYYYIFLITIEDRYNAVQYCKVLHKQLQELRQNMNQMLDPQKTPHTSP